MAGIVRAPDPSSAALEAGDLERCLAWAFLVRAGETN